VQLFGALLAETVLAPVPHRHLTFTVPKMLRPYFRFHRGLIKERILRHLALWEAGVRVDAARDPPEPAEPVIEPWLDDPFPDYDHQPVFAEN